MNIEGGYHTKEGWQFHKKTKDILRNICDTEKPEEQPDLRKLKEICVDSRLLKFESGERKPVNWDILLVIQVSYNRYLGDLYKELPVKEKIFVLGLKKLAIIRRFEEVFLVCYKVDKAYFSRFGALMTTILANADGFSGDDKSLALRSLQEWYNNAEGRERGKSWLNWFFDYFISHYERGDVFYRKSINYCVDMLIANKSNWVVHEAFAPSNWFSEDNYTNLVYGGGQ